MALIGGIIANYMTTGNTISLGSIIGLIAVFGITVRTTIAAINRYRDLQKIEDESFSLSLIEKGMKERLLPIIASMITIAMAFLPVVILGKIAGLEIGFSIATVVLGGIVSSILYVLIGVPAIYALFGKDHEADLDINSDVAVFED